MSSLPLPRLFFLSLVLGGLLLSLSPIPSPSANSAPPKHALLTMWDEVLAQVAKLRQLYPKRAIRHEVHDRSHIRMALRELMQNTLTPTEWEAERKALVKWGLLTKDFPLRPFVLALLTEQVAGYYDPQRHTFFIADWLPEALQKPVLIHELVHALQDQYYQLQRNFGYVKGHADLTLAHRALVEGDALAVMLAYMLQPFGLRLADLPSLDALFQQPSSSLLPFGQRYAQAPLVIREQLLFPYTYGVAFVQSALARGGWTYMDQVYRHPPTSTEQILHHEKYFSPRPELPGTVVLNVPETLFRGAWRKQKHDVLGEFLLRVILRQFLPAAEAQQSAAGWHGDRYELFERRSSQDLALISIIAWDTRADATEFTLSYKKLLTRKYPDWTMSPEGKGAYLWQRGPTRVLLSQEGRLVHIVEGVYATDLPRLRQLLAQVTIVSPQDTEKVRSTR